MGLIDFILNLAGLLLWLTWRSARFDPLVKPSVATLIGTLKRAGSPGLPRWKFPAALLALLVGRALIYWQIGPAVNWTPNLQLVAIAPSFRSEFLDRMLLFSFFSFGCLVAFFYLSLLLLSLVNRRVSDAEPLQKLVRVHLGWLERWPFALKILLPLVIVVLLWLALNPLLARLEIIPHARSSARVFQQGILIGIGTYLAWKYLIVVVLLLHLLNSYVYLGNHPVWNFVNLTSHHLLAPLRWLPLRLGRMDFSPLVGIALAFLIAESTAYWLWKLYPY